MFCYDVLRPATEVLHQTDRIFDIGDVVFTQVPEEERMQHASKLAEEGSKIGYKPRQLWVRTLQTFVSQGVSLNKILIADNRQWGTRPT